MRCPRCGREVRPEDQRCPGCGYPLTPTQQLLDREKFNEYKPSGMPPEPEKKPENSRAAAILKSFVRVIFYVALFVGCQSVVMGFYMLALIAQNPAALTDQAFLDTLYAQVENRTVHILLISNLLTVLLLCALMHIRRRSAVQELQLYPVNPFRFGEFALFGVVMDVFISISLPMIPGISEWLEQHNNSYAMLMSEDVNPLLTVLSVALAAGITEELVFRGLVISRLKRSMGTGAAVVISAVIFGAVHGTAVAFAYATVLGLLLGAMYARYDSVLPGMIFHVFFNLTTLILPDNPDVLPVLYIISVVLIPVCIWRVFLRYPVFNDIFTDVRDLIRPVNEEDAAIIAEVKRHQKNGMITVDELEDLHNRWTDNRKQYRKEKRKNRRK